jgi:hypothetical protein
MIRAIFDAIPFFAPYPAWVKALVSGWVLLTAVCIVVLLTVSTKPVANQTRAAEQSSTKRPTGDEAWLKINKVHIFDLAYRDAGVRITATINNNNYEYPNISGVKWVQTGPDMSPGLFRIPPSDVFEVVFSMNARLPGEFGPQDREMKFVSQSTLVIRKEELPKSGSYPLHQLGGVTRSAGISAEISYVISNIPD